MTILHSVRSFRDEVDRHATPAPLDRITDGTARIQVRPIAAAIDDVSHFDVTLQLWPVWNARSGSVGSYIIEPQLTVSDGFDFSSADLSEVRPRVAIQVARMTIDFAKSVLRDYAQPTRPFGLHLPLSVEAITPSLQCQELIKALKGIDEIYRNRIIIEIADCGPGVPQSRISDLLGVLRPYGRGILARMTHFAPPPLCWSRVGLTGIAVVLNSGLQRTESHFGSLPLVVRGHHDFSLFACHGIANQHAAEAAWDAGFTHFSGPFVAAGSRGAR